MASSLWGIKFKRIDWKGGHDNTLKRTLGCFFTAENTKESAEGHRDWGKGRLSIFGGSLFFNEILWIDLIMVILGHIVLIDNGFQLIGIGFSPRGIMLQVWQ